MTEQIVATITQADLDQVAEELQAAISAVRSLFDTSLDALEERMNSKVNTLARQVAGEKSDRIQAVEVLEKQVDDNHQNMKLLIKSMRDELKPAIDQLTSTVGTAFNLVVDIHQSTEKKIRVQNQQMQRFDERLDKIDKGQVRLQGEVTAVEETIFGKPGVENAPSLNKTLIMLGEKFDLLTEELRKRDEKLTHVAVQAIGNTRRVKVIEEARKQEAERWQRRRAVGFGLLKGLVKNRLFQAGVGASVVGGLGIIGREAAMWLQGF